MDLKKENELLREILGETVDQLEHVEELRRLNCGPIPATLSPDIITRAKGCLANIPGQERASPVGEAEPTQ